MDWIEPELINSIYHQDVKEDTETIDTETIDTEMIDTETKVIETIDTETTHRP